MRLAEVLIHLCAGAAGRDVEQLVPNGEMLHRTHAAHHFAELVQDIDDLGHRPARPEEHTYELQSLMRISYAVFCLKQNHTPPSNWKLTYSLLHHNAHDLHNE